MEPIVAATFLFIVAYFVGSLNSAIMVCRLLGLPDPRMQGSKNPGATNVLRLAGRREAFAVFCFDVAKGLVMVLLAKLFTFSYSAMGMVGLSVVVGHIFPVYYGFRGGKGVATALGVFLGIEFMFGIIVAAVWLFMFRFFYYSSLASLTMVLLAPFISISMLGNAHAFLPLFLITIMVVCKHHENIGRLFDGNESKVNFGSLADTGVAEKGQAAPSKSRVKKATTAGKKKATKAKKPVPKKKAAVKKAPSKKKL